MAESHQAPINLPRVAITFCTQCKWMLRAAYFGQELLSTFGTSIGEVALIPATGGLFQVHLTYKPSTAPNSEVQEVLIWDRKSENGFPETKILKQKIRNFIEPEKNLGHSDTPSSKARVADDVLNAATTAAATEKDVQATSDGTQDCEDCKGTKDA